MDIRTKITPVVAIVGRTNVGKSTLFNRLLEARKALTSPLAGTTRDANYGHFHWRGQTLTAVDTAGLDLTADTATEESLKRQAQAAMLKADIIIFVVDINDGVMPQDRALARHLQRSGKKVILAANKADGPKIRRLADSPDWLKLGFGEPQPISAANGSGVGDLLDLVADEVKRQKLDSKPLPDVDVKIAVIGRPNVGKSTLLNALAGEERVIVSEVPHTTTEPQDTLLTFEDAEGSEKHALIVDTVGIRKHARIERGLEELGVRMSLAELREADVAFLVIDAAQGADLQEKKLSSLIEESRLGVLLVINKWDLASERKLGPADEYRRYLQARFPFLDWAPLAFISAKTGSHVNRLLNYALDIDAQRRREIPQADLDAFIEKLKKIHHASFRRGEKRPKVYGMTQTGTKPPVFTLVVQDKETLHPNFLRFVERRLREEFGFTGTAIKILGREIEARSV